MDQLSDFKRGDTFSITCTWKENGIPASTAGLTIRSQIRNPRSMALVSDLVVTHANQTTHPGVFTLTPSIADTADWPTGNMIGDIEISKDGVTRSTRTFLVPIQKGVTE